MYDSCGPNQRRPALFSSVLKPKPGRGLLYSATERRSSGALAKATAKSVFLFDVQGSVAKSTFAGLLWLLYPAPGTWLIATSKGHGEVETATRFPRIIKGRSFE